MLVSLRQMGWLQHCAALPLARPWPSQLEALAPVCPGRTEGQAQALRAVWGLRPCLCLPLLLETPSQLHPVFPVGNHSCIPNAETSFPENNFLLHLTALEDIEAGEVRQRGPDEPGVASHLGRGSPCPLHPPRTPALYLLSLGSSWQRNSRLILCRGCQTPCFCLTPRGTGTNRAALGSWDAILSPTCFSLLAGNLHQLFRLLSEGAEQTQPQQDTQVGAAWRNPGGRGTPLPSQPVSLGCISTSAPCACPGVWLCTGCRATRHARGRVCTQHVLLSGFVAGCARSLWCFRCFELLAVPSSVL